MNSTVKAIIVIAIILVLVIAVCYIFGQREAATIAETGEEGTVLSTVYNGVNDYKDGFDLSAVTENPVTLATGVTGAVAVAVPLYTAYSDSKKKLTEAEQQIQANAANYQQELSTKTAQLQEADKTITDIKATAESQSKEYLAVTDKLATEKQQITEKLSSITGQLENTVKQNTVLQEAIGSEALKQLPGNSVLTLENGNKIATVLKQVIA